VSAVIKETPHGDLGPDLRDDEAVCPVTHMIYLKALGKSPWTDDNGKVLL